MVPERTTTQHLHDPPLALPVDEVLERLGGDRELLATLAALQQEESSRAVRELRAALDAAQAEQVQRTAHRLIGSLTVFGADEAAAAARTLEDLGRDHRLHDASAALQQLDLEIARLTVALDRLLETPAP